MRRWSLCGLLHHPGNGRAGDQGTLGNAQPSDLRNVRAGPGFSGVHEAAAPAAWAPAT